LVGPMVRVETGAGKDKAKTGDGAPGEESPGREPLVVDCFSCKRAIHRSVLFGKKFFAHGQATESGLRCRKREKEGLLTKWLPWAMGFLAPNCYKQ